MFAAGSWLAKKTYEHYRDNKDEDEDDFKSPMGIAKTTLGVVIPAYGIHRLSHKLGHVIADKIKKSKHDPQDSEEPQRNLMIAPKYGYPAPKREHERIPDIRRIEISSREDSDNMFRK